WLDRVRHSGKIWAKNLRYDETLGDVVLEWLKDPRRFSPSDLGFDWLMKLVARTEPRYHDFAVERMSRAFPPADFAQKNPAAAPAAPGAAPTVNLGGATFLFTGKMATMPRKEAEEKVRESGGVVAKSVTAKLHYLVIGDEGSPLFG